MVFPIPDTKKCIHGRARLDSVRPCVGCGKPTRSHRLEHTVEKDGRSLTIPVIATQSVTCPDCGAVVVVPYQAVQCHSCWEQAKQPEEL